MSSGQRQKIDQDIVNYEVIREDDNANQTDTVELEQMNEFKQRPEKLTGTTYRVKSPIQNHSMFITINDIVLNEGSEHEHRRPFEIFINSKDVEHYQWTVALTRIISAIFRKGGECLFLVEELRSVFDPKGGYFKQGGRYVSSLIAEIGDVIEQHMRSIGMIEDDDDEYVKAYIEQKKKEFDNNKKDNPSVDDSAQICPSCKNKTYVFSGGCYTCLDCGFSKCG